MRVSTAIVSGDSDYVPAIQVAKNEGVIVRLVHGTSGSYHFKLWEAVDERQEITGGVLTEYLLKKK